jgi:hypothetical protein
MASLRADDPIFGFFAIASPPPPLVAAFLASVAALESNAFKLAYS